MGWKKNAETCEFEPWEPDYLLIPNRHVRTGSNTISYWPEIPPLSYFFDSLNWKLFSFSMTFFMLLLFVTPAYAMLSDKTLDDLQVKIIMAESSGNPHAVGRSGERGLMQIKKVTWKQFCKFEWDDAFDRERNAQVGRRILNRINEYYGNRSTPALIVYSYNTGRFVKEGYEIPRWTANHQNRIYREILNAA